MKKRFLSVVLSACLLTGMLPGISISAAETETLQSILDAAEENTTIVLSEDYTESVTVAANKHVTIDLNGHTLTASNECALTNEGSLTIEDNAGTGSVTVNGTSSSELLFCAVKNNGSLTVKGAAISCRTQENGIAQGINNTGTLRIDEGKIHAATSGNKWAIALYNTGTAEHLNASLLGEIQNPASNDVNALAISNEAAGVIKEISGGSFLGCLNNNGIAFGIRNRGQIQSISGGEIAAITTGIKYAYGIHNEASGSIQEISGGKITGTIEQERNGNNALGIRNEGTIETITGGEFCGSILGGGSAYGIRNDAKEIRNVSGGMYRGNNASNPIYVQGGSITYADGYQLLNDSNHTGYQYVAEKGSVYTEILDEYEHHIATFFYDKDGNLLHTLGDIRDSYTLYQKHDEPYSKDIKTVTQGSEDFSKNRKYTTYITQTTDKPVYYFLGSSVTIGMANNAISFADYMAEDNNWICHKRAISGTTLVDDGGSGWKTYVQRLKTDIPEHARIDHFICQLSTNDASQSKPLGVLSSSYAGSDLNRSTIYGALEYIAYYCANVLHCELSFYTNPRYSNDAYQKMVDAVYKVADKWGVKVIDFYNYKDMDELPEETLRSYMADDIHPNEAGYRWMADVMGDFLKNYTPKEPETISLDQENLTLEAGETAQLTASVEPITSADKSVAWNSSVPSVASVDENGLITALSAGVTTITAKTVNGLQASCSVTVTATPVIVNPASIILDHETLSLEAGGKAQLTATVKPDDASDSSVTWNSSVPSVASVDENGLITALSAGVTTITAKTVNGLQASCSVTVTATPVIVNPAKVTLNHETLTLEAGGKAQLTASIEPNNAADTSVTWSSSVPSVASVDAAGIVTAIAAGETIITAKTQNGLQASCKITVSITLPDTDPVNQTKPIPVQKVAISGKKTLTEGQKTTLKAVVAPANASQKAVSWKSSNPKVASINKESGKITAKQAGKTIITASAADNSGVISKITVTVKPKKVTKLTVKVKKREAVVSFKKVSGIKKYTVRLYKGSKLIKTTTVKKTSKITINKKLLSGSYTIKVQYIKNKVKSDHTVKKFKVKKQ